MNSFCPLAPRNIPKREIKEKKILFKLQRPFTDCCCLCVSRAVVLCRILSKVELLSMVEYLCGETNKIQFVPE
jgi:hypothetical protein